MPDTPSHSNPSLDELLVEHLPRIRAFVRLNVNEFLRSRESCSDLVQSVCKDLLKSRGELDYRDEQSFRNWLYTAVLNKIRDHERYYRAKMRDPAREARLEPDENCDGLASCYASFATPSHHAAAREHMELLERAFERLPPHYRTVITLARIVGMPHAEIASKLDKSEGAVRVLLSRALVQLSAVLAELGTDTGL